MPHWLERGMFFLAPMAGYTDGPFRTVCKKAGCHITVTEMISAAATVRNNKKTLDMCHFDPAQRPIGIQLFGNKPDEMEEAARVIIHRYNPDFIDLNAGCPARKIANNESGASLMRDKKLYRKMLIAIKNAIEKEYKAPAKEEKNIGAVQPGYYEKSDSPSDKPPAKEGKKDLALTMARGKVVFSVKLRLGWDTNSPNALELIDIAGEEGASFAALHGRFKSQGYAGFADISAIREIAKASSLPIIGNGDIGDEKSLENMKNTGVFAYMVGRASIGAPWIFKELESQKVSNEEKYSLAVDHLNLVSAQGKESAFLGFRKHLSAYFKGLPNSGDLRNRSSRIGSEEEALKLLKMGFLHGL